MIIFIYFRSGFVWWILIKSDYYLRNPRGVEVPYLRTKVSVHEFDCGISRNFVLPPPQKEVIMTSSGAQS